MLPESANILAGCVQCGRPFGRAMLECPERALGRCPYLKQDLQQPGLRLFYFLLGSGGLVWLFLLFRRGFPSLSESIFFQLLFSIMLLLTGFWGMLTTQTRLYNPNTQLSWEQTALLGLPLKRKLTTAGNRLHIDLSLSLPQTLPLSLIAYFEETENKDHDQIDQAVRLFRSTIVGLLAWGEIQVHACREYTGWLWGKINEGNDQYLFSLSGVLTETPVYGGLERGILTALKAWPPHQASQAAGWLDRPSLYELIRAVYPGDVDAPEKWVLDLVAEDAIAQGWGRRTTSVFRYLEPKSNIESDLRSGQATIGQLHSQLALQQPEFYDRLDGEIKKAIKSRISSRSNLP